MTYGVAQKSYLKVEISEDLKQRFADALDEQGTTLTTGTVRLIESFLAMPHEMRAVLLGQLRGRGREAALKALVDAMNEKEGTKDRGSKR